MKMLKHSKLNPLFLLLNITFLSIFSSFCLASDLAKEKRWAEQITDSLMTGEAVWLQAGKTKFLSLFTESAKPKTVGAVILVHGIGVHPNWPDVIYPLRTELPEYGWASLSLQMPILENDKIAKDYVPLLKEVNGRFDAAVQLLKSKNIQNIVIIAHSLGTTMANYYLISKPDKTIRAYIAISSSTNPSIAELNNIKKIAKIKNLPVLDIYGSQDLDSVVRFAKKRLTTGKKVNPRYKQIQLKGADHFYQSSNPQLIKTIRLWLLKNALGTEIPTGIKAPLGQAIPTTN